MLKSCVVTQFKVQLGTKTKVRNVAINPSTYFTNLCLLISLAEGLSWRYHGGCLCCTTRLHLKRGKLLDRNSCETTKLTNYITFLRVAARMGPSHRHEIPLYRSGVPNLQMSRGASAKRHCPCARPAPRWPSSWQRGRGCHSATRGIRPCQREEDANPVFGRPTEGAERVPSQIPGTASRFSSRP